MDQTINLREKQKQATYQLLIETSLEVFAERGVLAATTKEIAERARVSHGTLFAHFATRQDLIVQVIEDFSSRVMRQTHELARGGSGIRQVLESHLSVLQENEQLYAHLIAEVNMLPDGARFRIYGMQSAISGYLYDASRQEMQSGTIKEMPTHLLFNTWIGLIHYYIANRNLFAQGSSVIEHKRKELVEHFLKIISNY